jgi:uncharacterized small protein (DUF1192 family)
VGLYIEKSDIIQGAFQTQLRRCDCWIRDVVEAEPSIGVLKMEIERKEALSRKRRRKKRRKKMIGPGVVVVGAAVVAWVENVTVGQDRVERLFMCQYYE